MNEIIARWARALRDAKENPKLLLEGKGKEAHRRMDVLHEAELAIRSLRWADGVPSEATGYIEADIDRGCGSCWLSSRRISNHPDCEMKINRYFARRDMLEAYGLGIPE